MKSPRQPGWLCLQHTPTAGAVPWGALWAEGPGHSAAECKPFLLLGDPRAPLCPCARQDEQQRPCRESQWGTASPIPHLGKQAEDEGPGDAVLTQLSLQELCFQLSNPIPVSILNNGFGGTLMGEDGMWGRHMWLVRVCKRPEAPPAPNNPVHWQSGLGNTLYQTHQPALPVPKCYTGVRGMRTEKRLQLNKVHPQMVKVSMWLIPLITTGF